MNRPERGEPRTAGATAAIILVVLGLGGLVAQLFSSLACGAELILVPWIGAERVLSVTVATALIVAGLVMIGRDR